VSQEGTRLGGRGAGKVTIEEEGRKMIFWNVAGVISEDEEFWEFVKEYDFVSLEETWMDGKSWEKLREWLPNSHEWKMMEARKKRRKGRAKGGMLLGKKWGWRNMGEKDW